MRQSQSPLSLSLSPDTRWLTHQECCCHWKFSVLLFTHRMMKLPGRPLFRRMNSRLWRDPAIPAYLCPSCLLSTVFYSKGSKKNFCSCFDSLSLVNFLQFTCYSRLSEQLFKSQAATWKPEQTSWRGLVEGFSELVSDFIAASRNFIIFSTKRQQNLVKSHQRSLQKVLIDF